MVLREERDGHGYSSWKASLLYYVQLHRFGSSKISRRRQNSLLAQNVGIRLIFWRGGSIYRLSGVFVIRRLRADMQFSAGGEQFSTKYIWQSLKDWKTYIASELCLLFLICNVSNDCLSGHIHGLVMSPQLSYEPTMNSYSTSQ